MYRTRGKNSRNSRKKNILFVLPYLVVGGAEYILSKIVKNLKHNGFCLSVITTKKPPNSMGDYTPIFEKITSEIYHLYNFLENPIQYEQFLYYIIESRKIGIIFIAGAEFIYFLLPKIKQKYPTIKIIDQLYNEFGHIHNNRKYKRYIDLNIVENENIEFTLLNRYKEKPQKIALIHNGVDVNNQYNPENIIDREKIYSEYSIPKNKYIVSFIGRFSQEKSPEIFIKIVNCLKSNKDFFFIMAGNGPLFEKIHSCIDRYRLNDSILLPGFVNTKQFLSITDVLILPSKIDGRPNIVLESLSMGIPVIATRVGGLPYIIKSGYNGYLCDFNNISQFLNSIIKLKEDKKLYLQIKKNARDYAIEYLDINKMLKTYLTIFNAFK